MSIISYINVNLSNVILSNDLIMYFSIDVKIFFKLIDEFSSFWKNNEFVVLSKKNWIKISFKFDWEKRVFEKTKIYFLKTRDKTLINKIFDELQNLNKLFWTNQSTFFNYSIFCVWKIVNEKRKKTRCNKHSWIQCYHAIERLFFVFTNEYYNDDTRLFLHNDNQYVRFFLSMTSAFQKSTQIDCCQSSKSKIIQCNDYKL